MDFWVRRCLRLFVARRSVLVGCLIFGLAHGSLRGAVNWVGSTGDWNDPANWSTGALPTSNDDVVIDSQTPITITHSSGTHAVRSLVCAQAFVLSGGTLSVSSNSQFNTLFDLSGGVISGSGDVTLAGTFTWSSGSMLSGGGKTIIAAGATATLTSAAVKGFSRNVDNAGTVNYTGNGLRFGEENVTTAFNNLTGGVFNITGEGDFLYNFNGSHRFNNAGTFNKNGTGTTLFSVAFNDSGAFNFTGGTIELNAGGSSTAAMEVGVGQTLNFNASYSFTPQGSLSGAGTINFLNGTYTFEGNLSVSSPLAISSSTLILNTAVTLPNLTLSGGTISGSGDLTITGSFNWSSGFMVGGGGKTILAAGATATFSGNNIKGFSRMIDNSGTVNYTGTGLRFGEQDIASIINNLSGGVFNVTGEGDFVQNYARSHAFNNAGTFNKSGAGTITSFIGVAFNHSGTFNLTQGRIDFGGGGGSTAAMSVGAGQTINFDQSFAFGGAGSLSGAGMVNFNGGTHTFTGNFTLTTPVTINGATVVFNNAQTLQNLTLASGILSGSGDVTITGNFNWSAGYMFSGGGKTIIAAGATATFSGTNNKGFSRTIDNAGTVNYTGNALRFGEENIASTINNLIGGVFNVIGEGDLVQYFQGSHAFNNAGTFNKSGAGTTTSFIGVAFNNTGTFNFTEGRIDFGGGGGSTVAMSVGAGQTINFDQSFNFGGAGSLSGAGMVNFNGGTHTFTGNFSLTTQVTINGATVVFNNAQTLQNLTLSSGILSGSGDVTITGSFNWSGGYMFSGGGKTIIAAGATATFSGTNNKGFSRTIDNAGTVNYTGNALRFGEENIASTINNLSGGVFNVIGEGDLVQYFQGSHAFNNAGTFNKSGAGTTTSFIGVAFNNTGTFNFTEGRIDFGGGGGSTAYMSVGVGQTINFDQSFNFGGAGSLSGAGMVNFNGGTHTFTGNFSLTTQVTINGATVVFNNAQTLQNLTLSRWDPLESTCRHASLSIL